MTDYARALEMARTVDPKVEHADRAPDVLLVGVEYAEEIIDLFPGSYRDDNQPATDWTRIVLPA